MSKQGSADQLSATSEQPGFLRGARDHWMELAQAVGVVQTRILLVVFYVVAVLPTGLMLRLTSDPLRLKHPKDGNWVPHSDEKHSIETARRQF